MSRDIKHFGPQKNSRYDQGVIHPGKCKKIFESQKHQPIIYRSSLEKKFIMWCENCSRVKKWGSECVQIPYFYALDNKYHTYNPDFVIEYTDGRRVIIEIKPYSQTQPPKNINNEYSKEQYAKNVSKWVAAKRFASDKGVEFIIITEKFFK